MATAIQSVKTVGIVQGTKPVFSIAAWKTKDVAEKGTAMRAFIAKKECVGQISLVHY